MHLQKDEQIFVCSASPIDDGWCKAWSNRLGQLGWIPPDYVSKRDWHGAVALCDFDASKYDSQCMHLQKGQVASAEYIPVCKQVLDIVTSSGLVPVQSYVGCASDCVTRAGNDGNEQTFISVMVSWVDVWAEGAESQPKHGPELAQSLRTSLPTLVWRGERGTAFGTSAPDHPVASFPASSAFGTCCCLSSVRQLPTL